MAVADARLDLQGQGRGGAGDPAHPAGEEGVAVEVLLAADDDPRRLRLQAQDVPGAAGGEPQPPPLADGEKVNPAMLAEDLSLPIDHLAGAEGAGDEPLDQPAVVLAPRPAGEAGLLALLFLRHRQPVPAGDFAHLLLAQPAHWKERPRQLPLGQGEEEVGLVLLPVRPAQEAQVAARLRPFPGRPAGRPDRAAGQPRVVASGQEAAAQLLGSPQQEAELHRLVAGDAGIGGQAGGVGGGEGADDLLLELPLQVDLV